MAMAVARMVNWPDTLDELGYPQLWDEDHFVRTLARRKGWGRKVWTSAYMITGGYSAGGEPKEVIIGRVLSALNAKLEKNPVIHADTLASASAKLKSPGIGTFLSAQIVADLKYGTLSNASDWWSWCDVGPGSTIGLNLLHDRPIRTGLNQTQFMAEVNAVRILIEEATGYELCSQDTQNCLCEFSKYVRAKYFGKAPKTAYRPLT